MLWLLYSLAFLHCILYNLLIMQLSPYAVHLLYASEYKAQCKLCVHMKGNNSDQVYKQNIHFVV